MGGGKKWILHFSIFSSQNGISGTHHVTFFSNINYNSGFSLISQQINKKKMKNLSIKDLPWTHPNFHTSISDRFSLGRHTNILLLLVKMIIFSWKYKIHIMQLTFKMNKKEQNPAYWRTNSFSWVRTSKQLIFIKQKNKYLPSSGHCFGMWFSVSSPLTYEHNIELVKKNV